MIVCKCMVVIMESHTRTRPGWPNALDRFGQCNECDWYADSSCTLETSSEVMFQSLVMLIMQMNRICSHYYITPLQLVLA